MKESKKISWIEAVLIAIDQLGNAIAGGNPDVTISARVGYFVHFGASKIKIYWRFLERVIDGTFYPLDGTGHCYQAYECEKGETFHHGNDLLLLLLSFFIIVSCIPLFVIIRVLAWIMPSIKNDTYPKCRS